MPASAQTPPPLPDEQCSTYAQALNTNRLPNGGSPYSSTNFYKLEDSKRKLADVAVVMHGAFPYAANTSWQVYPALKKLPNPAINANKIVPDPGNVNPNTPGRRVFAKNRNFSLIMVNAGTDLRALPTKNDLRAIARRNPMVLPAGQTQWVGIWRKYGSFTGFPKQAAGPGLPAGVEPIDWVTLKTYDIKTGDPVPCGDVEPLRDQLQKLTPWNVNPSNTGPLPIPQPLRPILPQVTGGHEQWTPKPNADLVEFFRVPQTGTGYPGGSYPPPDNCANYMQARLDTRRIALIRIPKMPSFMDVSPGPDAVYQEVDVQHYNLMVAGNARFTRRDGSPYTAALGGKQWLIDSTGGVTIVIWPRTLLVAQRRAVFAHARENNWNIVEGNVDGPAYANSAWIRPNGTSSDYIYGSSPSEASEGVPCYQGPQSTLDPYGLTALPDTVPFSDVPEEFAATPEMIGPATPQGVQCRTTEYLSGSCLTRLKEHIADTGGSYIAEN